MIGTAEYAEGAAYLYGRYVPIAQACIPVTDWGFTRSDAVYDMVHVRDYGFFRLQDHLDRVYWQRHREGWHRTPVRALLTA